MRLTRFDTAESAFVPHVSQDKIIHPGLQRELLQSCAKRHTVVVVHARGNLDEVRATINTGKDSSEPPKFVTGGDQQCNSRMPWGEVTPVTAASTWCEAVLEAKREPLLRLPKKDK